MDLDNVTKTVLAIKEELGLNSGNSILKYIIFNRINNYIIIRDSLNSISSMNTRVMVIYRIKEGAESGYWKTMAFFNLNGDASMFIPYKTIDILEIRGTIRLPVVNWSIIAKSNGKNIKKMFTSSMSDLGLELPNILEEIIEEG